MSGEVLFDLQAKFAQIVFLQSNVRMGGIFQGESLTHMHAEMLFRDQIMESVENFRIRVCVIPERLHVPENLQFRRYPERVSQPSIRAKTLGRFICSLPEDTRKRIDRLHAVFAFWNRKVSIPSPFLKEIIEAAMDHRILKMGYMSKSGNTIKEISPIGIYAYDGFWYMPAVDLALQELRLFRTDRILTLEITDRRCNTGRNLHDWLDGYQTDSSHEQIRLLVELDREGLRQCRSQPWLEPHVVAQHEDQGYIETSINRSEIEYVAKYFFQLGTAAKVIEPREIIEKIYDQAQALARHYAGHRS